jgi:ribonuclease HI
MELRAVTEALCFLSTGMIVHQGITQWIHRWKRNGWKNSKKGGVANATLWHELDSAVARQTRVDFI